MKYAELIIKDYPILLININPIDPNPGQIEDFFNEIESFMDSTEGPFVFISHSEHFKYLSSEARIHIGKRANLLNQKIQAPKKADIIVINGVLSNLILKSLALVYSPLKEAIILQTIEEGILKANQILATYKYS